MKLVGLVAVVAIAACRTAATVPSRPPMDSAMAAKLCSNPGAVTQLGAECVLRDQSPPIPVLEPPGPFE
jgi:hypothetical protein